MKCVRNRPKLLFICSLFIQCAPKIVLFFRILGRWLHTGQEVPHLEQLTGIVHQLCHSIFTFSNSQWQTKSNCHTGRSSLQEPTKWCQRLRLVVGQAFVISALTFRLLQSVCLDPSPFLTIDCKLTFRSSSIQSTTFSIICFTQMSVTVWKKTSVTTKICCYIIFALLLCFPYWTHPFHVMKDPTYPLMNLFSFVK